MQDVNVSLKTLTLDPLAFTIEDYVHKSAAQRMIRIAEPKLKKANILTQDSLQPAELGDVRTCWEAWLLGVLIPIT